MLTLNNKNCICLFFAFLIKGMFILFHELVLVVNILCLGNTFKFRCKNYQSETDLEID